LAALFLLAFLAIGAETVCAGGKGAGDGGAGPKGRRPAPHAKAVDYVAQLKSKELAFLRSKIKGWDKLDSRKKQKIARNVVRIRNMSPEQRKRFEERLRHMRGKQERWGRVRDHGGHMLVNRGLARAGLQALGREFEGKLRRLDISSHVFETAFARSFWGHVAESGFRDGKPPAPETLTAGAVTPGVGAGPMIERYRRAYEQYGAATDEGKRKGMRRRLGYMLGYMRARKLREDLARSDVRGTDAYLTAVAKRVKQTWPQAFAQSVKDPKALLRSAENEEVRRSLRRLIHRDGKLSRDEASLVVKLVERWAINNRKGDADAGAEADAVIRRVLRADLKLPAKVVDTLPPRSAIEKRAAWYLRVFGRSHGVLGHGASHRGASDGRPGGPGRRGKVGFFEQPAGVSEADWSAFQQARRKAGGRPSLAGERPEGVSEAGWALLQAAWRKRMKAFGRGRR